MRRKFVASVVVALILGACGQGLEGPRAGGGEVTQTGPALERIVEACERVVTALIVGHAGRLVGSLEDIDAALSTDSDLSGLREQIQVAADALPVFGDTPLSAETMADVAPALIALSNGLISAGIDECAGVGEIAAGYDYPGPDDLVATEKALVINRAKWSSQGIRTYSMELSVSYEGQNDHVCGVDGSVLIQVVNGRVEDAVDRLAGCHVDLGTSGVVPLTVGELFEMVEENIEADVIEVDYEPTLGYPRSVYMEQDGNRFVSVWVSEFTPGGLGTSAADAVLAQLTEQRETWAAEAIANYTITVEIGCFCPEEYRGPFVIAVVDGIIEQVTRNGEIVTAPFDESFLTVEGLFATVERYAYADQISVNYSSLGYPSIVDVDPSFNTIDEELRIDVLDLVPNS